MLLATKSTIIQRINYILLELIILQTTLKLTSKLIKLSQRVNKQFCFMIEQLINVFINQIKQKSVIDRFMFKLCILNLLVYISSGFHTEQELEFLQSNWESNPIFQTLIKYQTNPESEIVKIRTFQSNSQSIKVILLTRNSEYHQVLESEIKQNLVDGNFSQPIQFQPITQVEGRGYICLDVYKASEFYYMLCEKERMIHCIRYDGSTITNAQIEDLGGMKTLEIIEIDSFERKVYLLKDEIEILVYVENERTLVSLQEMVTNFIESQNKTQLLQSIRRNEGCVYIETNDCVYQWYSDWIKINSECWEDRDRRFVEFIDCKFAMFQDQNGQYFQTEKDNSIALQFHPSHKFLFFNHQTHIYNSTIIFVHNEVQESHYESIITLGIPGIYIAQSQKSLDFVLLHAFRNYKRLFQYQQIDLRFLERLQDEKRLFRLEVNSFNTQSVEIRSDLLSISEDIILHQVFGIQFNIEKPVRNYDFENLINIDKESIMFVYPGQRQFIQLRNGETKILCDGQIIESQKQKYEFLIASVEVVEQELNFSTCALVGSRFYYLQNDSRVIKIFETQQSLAFSTRISSLQSTPNRELLVTFEDGTTTTYNAELIELQLLKNTACNQNYHYCVNANSTTLTIVINNKSVLFDSNTFYNTISFNETIVTYYINGDHLLILFKNQKNNQLTLRQYYVSSLQIYFIKTFPLVGYKIEEKNFKIFIQSGKVIALQLSTQAGEKRIVTYDIEKPSHQAIIQVFPLLEGQQVYVMQFGIVVKLNQTYFSLYHPSRSRLWLRIPDSPACDKILKLEVKVNSIDKWFQCEISLINLSNDLEFLKSNLKHKVITTKANQEPFFLSFSEWMRGSILEVSGPNIVQRPLDKFQQIVQVIYRVKKFMIIENSLIFSSEQSLFLGDLNSTHFKLIYQSQKPSYSQFHFEQFAISGKSFVIIFAIQTSLILRYSFHLLSLEKQKIVWACDLPQIKIDPRFKTIYTYQNLIIINFATKFFIFSLDRVSEQFDLTLKYQSVNFVDQHQLIISGEMVLLAKVHGKNVLLEAYNLSQLQGHETLDLLAQCLLEVTQSHSNEYTDTFISQINVLRFDYFNSTYNTILYIQTGLHHQIQEINWKNQQLKELEVFSHIIMLPDDARGVQFVKYMANLNRLYLLFVSGPEFAQRKYSLTTYDIRSRGLLFSDQLFAFENCQALTYYIKNTVIYIFQTIDGKSSQLYSIHCYEKYMARAGKLDRMLNYQIIGFQSSLELIVILKWKTLEFQIILLSCFCLLMLVFLPSIKSKGKAYFNGKISTINKE